MAGVSDADRQLIVDELERRAARGRITAAELADRVHRARSVITHAGLEGILLDLPDAPSFSTHRPWSLPGAPDPDRGTSAGTGPEVALVGAGSATTGPAPLSRSALLPPPLVVLPQPPLHRRVLMATAIVVAMVAVGAVFYGITALHPSIEDVPGAASARPADREAVETVVLAVGPDIRSGVYVAEPEVGMCRWERTELLPGGDPDLVVGGGATARLLIEVVPNDYRIRLRNCGPLVPYVPPATPATSLGEGDWLVGSDVVPGHYRVTDPDPDATGCRWSQAPGPAFAPSDVVHAMAGRPHEVELVDGERFSSTGCGTWTRQ